MTTIHPQAKMAKETNENDLPKDLSADNGEIESEIPDMEWIDALSDPIEENSKEERLVDSDISHQASGNIDEASEDEAQPENENVARDEEDVDFTQNALELSDEESAYKMDAESSSDKEGERQSPTLHPSFAEGWEDLSVDERKEQVKRYTKLRKRKSDRARNRANSKRNNEDSLTGA